MFHSINGTNDFQNLYTYDRLNRLTQIVQQANGGYAVGYKKTVLGYDAASRLTSLADYKDSTTQAVSGSYGYDAVNRLTSLTWFGPGGPFNSAGSYTGGSYGGYFESMSWGYDIDNRVASMTNLDYANENLNYTYDHDSQLINAAAGYGGYGGYGGLGGGSYSWDDNGNSTKSGWITGAGNRLLFDATYSYVYDESGHIVQRSTSTAETDYLWDNRGRLFSVKDYTKSGSTLTQIQQIDYGYDPFNDLISRTLTPYAGGSAQTPQIARFVYDLAAADALPSPPVGEGSGMRGSGNAVLAFSGNQSMTDRYLWGPAVDQILADERFTPSGSNQMPSSAGTTYWALTDNENSVRDWITYGSLVDHIVYDSFGKVFSQSNSSVPFAFGHNGVFYDPATGLEWHNDPSTRTPGRWYNPAIQRWMSEDPTGLKFDSNAYRYVGNSPTNFVDPSGKDITLELGNNAKGSCGSGNNALHEQICVDEWGPAGQKIGKRCFSFGSLGNALLWIGQVYEANPVPGASISFRKTTTKAEDEAFLRHLRMLEGQVRPYSVFLPFTWNCKDFSDNEFNNAPGTWVVPWTLYWVPDPSTGPWNGWVPIGSAPQVQPPASGNDLFLQSNGGKDADGNWVGWGI